jgi:hypothetical protein
VVGVYPLYLVGPLGGDAHAVIDHEVGERLPVDEDHLARELPGVLKGTIREVGGGEEDTLDTSTIETQLHGYKTKIRHVADALELH